MASQMGPVPQKIVLKSTTKMSLNERFSQIETPRTTVQSMRTTMAAQSQGAAKTRRYDQQMANRPVSAQTVVRVKKRSIKQRLGTSVKARLGKLPGARGSFRGQSARGTQRGGTFRGGVTKGQYQGVQRGRGSMVFTRGGRGAYSSLRGFMRGGRGRGRGGYQTTSVNRYQNRGGRRGQAFRGRGRGTRGGQKSQVSREDLDNELDSYMSGAQ